VSEADQDVPVPGVPPDKPLRVTVRAGHFAGGCTTVPPLMIDERRSVSVTVTDRPLDMTNVRIPTILGIDQKDDWAAGFSSLAALMASKAARGSKSDATALLDEMVVATPFLWQDEFIHQRRRLGWDERVAHVFDGGDTAFRDRLQTWIDGGLASLATNAIAGTLTSPGGDLGTASLAVTQVAGASPADSGFPDRVELTWTSAEADHVLFGATATWQPSRLGATLAYAAAKKEFPAATSVPNALAEALSCKQMGQALAADVSDALALNCDAACLASRCEEALEAMWARARNASTGRAALHIAATGSAKVDDDAHPVGFAGSWVGDVSLGASAIRVGGAARGVSPGAEPR
jgi:hypothetical protein